MKTGYSTRPEPATNSRDVLDVIRARHSARTTFDPKRTIPEPVVAELLEAARWAPTAHNMQNFEIIVVDDPAVLRELGAIGSPVSETFVRENYRQLAFSADELRRKQTGVLAEMFPPAWRDPDVTADALHALPPTYLRDAIHDAPMVLVVMYDPRRRAPASEGDVLGMMSLGCVMQNLWLAAHALGLGVHVISAAAGPAAAGMVKAALGIPAPLEIAFAMALGHGTPVPPEEHRVRRDVAKFAHRNRY